MSVAALDPSFVSKVDKEEEKEKEGVYTYM